MHWPDIGEEDSPETVETHKEVCPISLGFELAAAKCTCGEIHPYKEKGTLELHVEFYWNTEREMFLLIPVLNSTRDGRDLMTKM